ncbi:arsenate reductase ArsC [Blastopirellula marina]|uniref:Low molecular weight phosphatase family protein n=1 Tax=Blastopirellula marina TaxID=124 RepID=A0A2S8FNQ7_9BACT|nr:arsenate reductase ArsC [Blastopirellula marina]PQO33797.1 low molecular weight phosphatase family protein [Blastopirellula marina]PTL43584.1 arsenate reductase ArsC [Blastopirellula marina]
MKRVLILCTGNSCRSQMAEALWAKLGQGEWEAHSAGSKPSGYVHPLAIAAMQELGIDISAYQSKSAQEFQQQPFDLVVTVCDNAKETCPVYPGAKETLHWPFEDPADATGTDDEKLPTFRRIRDEIRAKIADYLGIDLTKIN